MTILIIILTLMIVAIFLLYIIINKSEEAESLKSEIECLKKITSKANITIDILNSRVNVYESDIKSKNTHLDDLRHRLLHANTNIKSIEQELRILKIDLGVEMFGAIKVKKDIEAAYKLDVKSRRRIAIFKEASLISECNYQVEELMNASNKSINNSYNSSSRY